MSREIEAFVYREARLLDEWRLEEWLDLFTGDGVYWVPIDDKSDPEQNASIIYDNKRRREMRVDQLIGHGVRASQHPRSETIHIIGNVEVHEDDADRVSVRYNAAIVETRPGDWRLEALGEQRLLAARCSMRLRRVDGVWKIEEKKTVLSSRGQPLDPLTVII